MVKRDILTQRVLVSATRKHHIPYETLGKNPAEKQRGGLLETLLKTLRQTGIAKNWDCSRPAVQPGHASL
jgi:hypothetical protein